MQTLIEFISREITDGGAPVLHSWNGTKSILPLGYNYGKRTHLEL
jgi:hypothetical protein